MKISYSIMAHPRRKDWAEKLAKQLNAPIYWDTDNTVWNTCKGAWQLAKNSDYHFVIQDDAILSKRFKARVKKLVEKIHNEKGERAFQLYFGKNKKMEIESAKQKGLEKGYIETDFLLWGVAIGIPTKYIREMIDFGDNWSTHWQDDSKIKNFLISKGLNVIFTTPCLVDHRKMEENPTLVPAADSDKSSPVFIENIKIKKPIPKILHQIWIGDPNKKPVAYMDTWKMEGWEYKLWTEKEINKLGLKNQKIYDYFYEKECWYGCSDVVRIEILEKYGGMYIDADTERLASINDIFDDGPSFVSSWSSTEGRIANGFIASIPKHPIISNYIKEMGTAPKIEPVWNTIGGTLFTEMIFKHQDENTKLLPTVAFYPYSMKGIKNSGRTKNYGRHYWGSTYNLY